MMTHGELVWRCRRGTKELDWVMTRFLAEIYPGLPAETQAAFGLFLQQQDPVIVDWLNGVEKPDDTSMQNIVDLLLEKIYQA